MSKFLDSLRVPKFKDKRRKLSDEDKEKIKKSYIKGVYGCQRIAKEWGISKRMVQFIVDSAKREKAQELYKKRRVDGRYYEKEKHTEAMRRHRKHVRACLGIPQPRKKSRNDLSKYKKQIPQNPIYT